MNSFVSTFDGQEFDATLFRYCLQNRLTNPPYSVGYKFKTFSFIKSFSCFYKPYVPFINKVT